MLCSKCGKEIHDDSLFCEFCGEKIDDIQIVLCPNCGESIPEDSLFCPKCGASVNNMGEDSLGTGNTNWTSSTIISNKKTLGLVAAVLLIALAIIIIPKGSNNSGISNNDSAAKNEDYQSEQSTENVGGSSDSLETLESGYTYVDSENSRINDHEPYVVYGVKYRNKEEFPVYGWLQTKVTSKDENGGVIASNGVTNSIYLPAGAEAVMGGISLGVTKKPSDVQISVYLDPLNLEREIDLLETTGVNIIENDDERHIVGEIINNSSMDIDYANVYYLFRDSKGKITAGGTSYENKISQGDNAFDDRLSFPKTIEIDSVESTAMGRAKDN